MKNNPHFRAIQTWKIQYNNREHLDSKLLQYRHNEKINSKRLEYVTDEK